MRRVLPLSSTANNAAAAALAVGDRAGGRVEASDFLTGSVNLLASSSDLHYQQQQQEQDHQPTGAESPLCTPQPVPDSQSSVYDLSSQHNHQLHHHQQQQQHHLYQHQVLLEERPPPSYQECIRSSSYNLEGNQL